LWPWRWRYYYDIITIIIIIVWPDSIELTDDVVLVLIDDWRLIDQTVLLIDYELIYWPVIVLFSDIIVLMRRWLTNEQYYLLVMIDPVLLLLWLFDDWYCWLLLLVCYSDDDYCWLWYYYYQLDGDPVIVTVWWRLMTSWYYCYFIIIDVMTRRKLWLIVWWPRLTMLAVVRLNDRYWPIVIVIIDGITVTYVIVDWYCDDWRYWAIDQLIERQLTDLIIIGIVVLLWKPTFIDPLLLYCCDGSPVLTFIIEGQLLVLLFIIQY